MRLSKTDLHIPNIILIKLIESVMINLSFSLKSRVPGSLGQFVSDFDTVSLSLLRPF